MHQTSQHLHVNCFVFFICLLELMQSSSQYASSQLTSWSNFTEILLFCIFWPWLNSQYVVKSQCFSLYKQYKMSQIAVQTQGQIMQNYKISVKFEQLVSCEQAYWYYLVQSVQACFDWPIVIVCFKHHNIVSQMNWAVILFYCHCAIGITCIWFSKYHVYV